MKQLNVQEALRAITDTQNGGGVMRIPGTNMNARAKVLYFAGLATALANKNGHVIDQQTQKGVGVTNTDGGNKLNSGKAFLATGIRILFDTTASATTLDATWLSAAPANFKNGEIIISQSGTGNLFESPVGPLAGYNASIAVEAQFKTIAPFMIRSNVEYFIQFVLASAGAANQAYRIEIDGYELTEASVA